MRACSLSRCWADVAEIAMSKPTKRLVTILVLGIPLSLCAAAVARDKRGRSAAQGRLAQLEAAVATQLPRQATAADVIHFFDTQGLSYPNADARQLLDGDCGSGVHGVVGAWHGPVFERALFLWFDFDIACRTTGHRSQEVAGS